ncbi:MAG: cytochrome c biogenesis protein CcsA [Gammaproteobacteria bacterium]|nr:cytochrome c biogenesis protein CcsA [Gammaproteobacteria bacterium]
MTNPALNFLALALYVAVGVLLVQRLVRGQGDAARGARLGVLALGLGAAVLHAALLYPALRLEGGLNLALTTMFSLAAWVVVVLYLCTSALRPIDYLGILIMPLAGLTLLVEWLWPGQAPMPLTSGFQAAHIVISILAYGFLCLAAVQSLLLLYQERHLHARQPGGLVRALPPMQVTETALFQMIGLGFVLLTLTVASGVFFSEETFGRPFKFTHHIVLALIAWGVYGVLLLGRWRLGWRGRPAIRLALAGFALLVLAYFGSKFVLEVLLGR